MKYTIFEIERNIIQGIIFASDNLQDAEDKINEIYSENENDCISYDDGNIVQIDDNGHIITYQIMKI